MITEKDIERMATLAKLEIPGDDVPFYINEIQALFSFARSLDDVPDTAEYTAASDAHKAMRDDMVTASVSQADALKNTAEYEDGFFRLRKGK